ncbi:PREDICTED: sialin-like [Priapulus caudatus]|uniref:Sialin-like n=1 Tax=Priapulus caudatus TaxID=37621 RepID=A0ABM1F268_PRICU|nr:PREDICTED: sialin-like [Priapulus caudatus]
MQCKCQSQPKYKVTQPSLVFAGGAGCLTSLWYLYVVYDSPEEHPRISEVERNYIKGSLKGQVHTLEKLHKEIPWGKILTSPTVWLLMYTFMTYAWGLSMTLTNLPTYMFEILKYDMKSNGLLSALPFISSYVAQNISGALADFAMSRDYLSRVWMRRIWTTIGLFGTAIFLVIAGYIDCKNAWLAVLMMVIGNFCNGFIFGGLGVAHLDVAPRFASVIFGVITTVACLCGIMSPYLIGIITTDQTQQQWQTVFYINLAIQLSGAILFGIFFHSDILPWAAVDVDDTVTLAKEARIHNGLYKHSNDNPTHHRVHHAAANNIEITKL